MSNGINYPVALSKETNKLVHISEVQTGFPCYCYYCNCDMQAVNRPGNRVRPHFKHAPGTDCKATEESYIHWLAKHIISENIHQFTIPGITIYDIMSLYSYGNYKKSKFYEVATKLFDKHNVPENLRFNPDTSFVVQENSSGRLTNAQVEKAFKIGNNSVRIDVSVELSGTHLFIEPFYSNPINGEKLTTLNSLDQTTLIIDLKEFKLVSELHPTLDRFKRFLLNPNNYKWAYIRKSHREKLYAFFEQEFEKAIIPFKSISQEYSMVLEKKEGLIIQQSQLEEQIKGIRKKIDSISHELYKTENQLENLEKMYNNYN